MVLRYLVARAARIIPARMNGWLDRALTLNFESRHLRSSTVHRHGSFHAN